MEKLLLVLLYTGLNTGLYVLFISPWKGKFSKIVKTVFLAMFLILCILWGVFGASDYIEFNVTFSVFVLGLMAYVFYRVITPFLDQQEKGISKQRREKLMRVLSGVFILIATVVQILMLFGLV